MWVDANHDGKTDIGELKGLADFGVVEIDLSYALSSKSDNGNLHGMVSSWTASDGSKHDVADVWFAKDVPPGSTPVTLGDVLAPPAAELLAGGAPTSVVASVMAGASATVHATVPIPQRSLLDDELNKHNLLI